MLFFGMIYQILYKSEYMTGVNTGNTREISSESANKKFTTQEKNQRLLRAYVWKKLENTDQRLSFAQEIGNTPKLTEKFIEEIRNFQEWKSEFQGASIDENTFSAQDIHREIWQYLVGIESQKMTLRKTILQEYDISPHEYDQSLSPSINAITKEKDIQSLCASSEKREAYITNTCKKKTPKRKLVSKVLKDLDIEKRFDRLEPHLQTAFQDNLRKMRWRERFELEDIMVFFESKILTTKEKQGVIEACMPDISLDDILQLKLWDISVIRQVKRQLLEYTFWDRNLDGIHIDNYIDEIDNKKVFVSTKGIFENAEDQEKLFEKNFFFEKFQKELNTVVEKIEERLSEKSIQSVREMQDMLSSVDHISWIEHFQQGATIIVKKQEKDASWNTKAVTLFADIVSLWTGGTFTIAEKWVDIYDNSARNVKTSRQTYSEFVDFATKGHILKSVEIASPEILDHKIRAWEVTDKNMNGRFESRLWISQEIDELNRQIESYKEFMDEGIPLSDFSSGITLYEAQEHADQERLSREESSAAKLKELYKLKEEKISFIESIEVNNLTVLRNALNEYDYPWEKYGFERGVNFVTDEGKWDVYSLQDIDEVNQKITIKWLGNSEIIDYHDFLTAFKKKKSQRVSKINDFWELFHQTDDTYTSWSNFELQEGKIKNKKTKLNVDYDYLVPKKDSSSQELLKIHGIEGSMIRVSFWEAKTQKKAPKKWDEKWEIFAVENRDYYITAWVLDHYIRKNKLEFRSIDEEKVKEEEIAGIPTPETKFGLMNWFFQNMSIAAAIKWWQTGLEQIKNMLTESEDDKANKFALSVFWPLLWDSRTDLVARVEQTQKKNMDEIITRLKDINSKIATRMIESWLKDPRTPEYKKEAGMFYMFEKYGALCAKELYKYQGQYFWYQKMWGRIGDSNWKDVHTKNNRDPKQNTTEEELVYMLMKKQTAPGWYNGVSRRSKLDKELKAKRGQGKDEEYETGKKDGGNERDIKDRLDWGLSELESGNYPNAFGWLESVTDKWGTMKQMNMIPFVMVFSGMAYNYEKNLLDKVKRFPGESRMLMMLRMMSYRADIDLLNDTIMKICTRLETRGHSGIEKKARRIYDNRYEKIDERQKQRETITFYEEYGEILTNILYMLNTWNTEDKHNKMIFFEKDEEPIFRQYYEKMQWYIYADGNYGANEELMADAFAMAGTSWVSLYRATKQLLEKWNDGIWRKHEAWPIMWKEIENEFKAIPKRDYYPGDPEKTRKMQEKLLEHNLREFISAVLGTYTSWRGIESFNAPTWYHTALNHWGVYFNEMVDAWADVESIKKWGNKDLLDRLVRQVIDYEIHGISYKRPTRSDGKWGYIFTDTEKQEDPETLSDLIKGKASDTIGKSKRAA